MVSNRDLLLGVERGIISQDQLTQLVSLAAEAPPKAEALMHYAQEADPDVQDIVQDVLEEAQDEAPRFIRSFGDLFIAIGTGFLGAGLMAAVSYLGDTLSAQIGALVIIWLAAEWLTGYLRISAPSIVLSVLFTGFVAYYYMSYSLQEPLLLDFNNSSSFDRLLTTGLSAMLASSLFYARFRLPFALALFGLALVTVLVVVIGTISTDFLWTYSRWIIGLGGLSLFAVAMWFDTKDPLRKSRLSDCGFWLHLIAAPLLTHAMLWDSHPAIASFKKTLGADAVANGWIIITAFFVLFGIVALVINRRALLISSLGYIGSVIAYGIWHLQLPAGAATSAVLLIAATLILSFGVGWKPLRRLVFMVLPQGEYLDKLPPAHA